MRTAAVLAIALTLLTAPGALAKPTLGMIVVSDSADNDTSTNTFKPDAAEIVLQVELKDVGEAAKLGAVWIAEKTEAAPPDYEIDSVELTAEPSMNTATFRLSRPNDGWPAGDYRVELSIDGELAQTVRFKITP